MQTKLNCVIFYTVSPSLPAPTRTSHPCHHHISTGQHPIISTLTFHMPKLSQSTMPHHFNHALNTQKTVQDLTSLPILQRLTTIIRSALSRLCRFSATIKLTSTETHQRRWIVVCRKLNRHWHHRTWRTAFRSAIYWQTDLRWKEWSMKNVIK